MGDPHPVAWHGPYGAGRTWYTSLGHADEAQEAYRKGIEAAPAHGHPSMAAEFEDILEMWD